MADVETNTTENTETQAPETRQKIYFVGTRYVNGEEVRSPEAPTWLKSGRRVFDDLPESQEQLDGFYYERAAELCRAFPGLYKKDKPLAEEATQAPVPVAVSEEVKILETEEDEDNG